MTLAFPFVRDESEAQAGGDLARAGELERTGPTGCMWRMLGLPAAVVISGDHCLH